MPLSIGLTASKLIQHLFFLSFTWFNMLIFALYMCSNCITICAYIYSSLGFWVAATGVTGMSELHCNLIIYNIQI